jgi:hypothetical protein
VQLRPAIQNYIRVPVFAGCLKVLYLEMHPISSQKILMLSKFLFFAISIFIVVLHFCLQLPGVDASIHMYGGFLVNKGYEPHQHINNNKPTMIYLIGAAGFFVKSNPFLGVRIIELIVFGCNLFLINGITKTAGLRSAWYYLLSFTAIYLVCWDEGFLTETFNIPLVLLTVYLFLRKIRHFEFVAALLLVLSFLLKQNAIGVIGGVMIIDVFSSYRKNNLLRKLVKYTLALLLYSFAWYAIMQAFGAWDDFLYQTITYNSKYASRLPFFRSIMNHLRNNNFLSVKGISVILVFNACILVTLWKFLKKYRKNIPFTFEERFTVSAIFIYIPSYFLTYISGLSHPHYFMLLIVPATFILARYVATSLTGKAALLVLLAFGTYRNLQSIKFNPQLYKSREEVAAWLKAHTISGETIHMTGLRDQYVYVMTDRLSNTRFIIPIFENHGYRESDKQEITRDFRERPPRYIVMPRHNLKPGLRENFYFKTLLQTLKDYHEIDYKGQYIIYENNQ